jgi:hypothetical protein
MPTPAGATTANVETREPRAPSRRWYRVAVVIMMLGFAAAAAWWPYADTGVFRAVEGFTRLSRFGGEVQIAEPGRHTFWIEGPCLSCHDNSPASYRKAATVSLQGPGGQAVPLRPIATNWLYNTSRREGRSLWVFDVTDPGAHRIKLDFNTTAPDWDNTPPSNIAISPGEGLPVRILRPMATFVFGGIGIAGALALVTRWRRKRFYDRTLGPARRG